jgi:DNA polymerase-3 subunit gamma/tau
MAKTHLTVKYRPQTFAEVVGQDTVRAILSRAAETDAIAPAYMFSGTRGVGKTTLARVLAKAVNCEKGPAAEPCNECRHCRRIQSGAAVDVIEIDAASNTGVDNIRSLKEDVGYAPMECRYKVFIIDEAHMLSKSAFNALLKTLEEPPGRVAFIMATTEPHKFPPTIVSRCQHYIFQRLTQKEIAAHLAAILEREGLEYEPAAVNLLARRGAGSVRDAMSLMGQVLALGGESLQAESVRRVLGLAGQEIFFRLVRAIHEQDCMTVTGVLNEVMDQGLDLGFFLAELTQVWRNLFLLSQAGEKAFPVLEAPEEDAAKWLEWAPAFSLAHVHACWQMTLEGQQRVKNSLDPALALELLLLNLAYLPRLMPLPEASKGSPPGNGGDTPGSKARESGREPEPAEPEPVDKGPEKQEAQRPDPEAVRSESEETRPEGPRDWRGFVEFCAPRVEGAGLNGGMLQKIEGEFEDERLVVKSANGVVLDRLEKGEAAERFHGLIREYFGRDISVEFERTQSTEKTRADLEREAKEHPVVKEAMQELDAGLLGVEPLNSRKS